MGYLDISIGFCKLFPRSNLCAIRSSIACADRGSWAQHARWRLMTDGGAWRTWPPPLVTGRHPSSHIGWSTFGKRRSTAKRIKHCSIERNGTFLDGIDLKGGAGFSLGMKQRLAPNSSGCSPVCKRELPLEYASMLED